MIKNKYFITFMVFFIWLLFFDQNNLIDFSKDKSQMKKLQADISYYQDKFQADSVLLNELQTNRKNLEKFARENYLMKKSKEDLFIFVEE